MKSTEMLTVSSGKPGNNGWKGDKVQNKEEISNNQLIGNRVRCLMEEVNFSASRTKQQKWVDHLSKISYRGFQHCIKD